MVSNVGEKPPDPNVQWSLSGTALSGFCNFMDITKVNVTGLNKPYDSLEICILLTR